MLNLASGSSMTVYLLAQGLVQSFLYSICWPVVGSLVGSFLKGIVRSIGPSSQTLVDWAVLLPLSRQAGENISELSSFHDLVLTLYETV